MGPSKFTQWRFPDIIWGVCPKWMVYKGKILLKWFKMDDLGVPPFMETPNIPTMGISMSFVYSWESHGGTWWGWYLGISTIYQQIDAWVCLKTGISAINIKYCSGPWWTSGFWGTTPYFQTDPDHANGWMDQSITLNWYLSIIIQHVLNGVGHCFKHFLAEWVSHFPYGLQQRYARWPTRVPYRKSISCSTSSWGVFQKRILQ